MIFKKKRFFCKLFQEYSQKNLRIFHQKQSQKQLESRWVWFMLSYLHPYELTKSIVQRTSDHSLKWLMKLLMN